MFEVSVDANRLNLRLGAMGAKVRASLLKQVYRTAIDLQRYVVQEKLSEPGTWQSNPSLTTLHRVTGTLARSIQERVTDTPSGVSGQVFSAGDVPYAKLLEDGGSITRYGRKAGDYTVHITGRRYMKSSFEENREKIVNDLTAAVRAGLHD